MASVTQRDIGPAGAHALERTHQHLETMARRQKPPRAGAENRERSVWLVAVCSDENWSLRCCRGQKSNVVEVNLPAGRSGDEDHIELLAMPQQLR
jgi:hypothetical protein